MERSILSGWQKALLPAVFLIGTFFLTAAMEYYQGGNMFVTQNIAYAAGHALALMGTIIIVVWSVCGTFAALIEKYQGKSRIFTAFIIFSAISAMAYLYDSTKYGVNAMIIGDMGANISMIVSHQGSFWLLANSAGWSLAATLALWLFFIYQPQKKSL